MADLVDIGFVVNAKGLKEAEKAIDALLKKVDKLNTTEVGVGSKTSTKGGSSKGADKAEKESDRVTKAMERQRIVAEYLAKGYDKSTASAMATFKQMGASTAQIEQQLSQLGKNKGILQLQQDLKNTQQLFENISRNSTRRMGGGILDGIGFQEQDLKNLNNSLRELEREAKERTDRIYDHYNRRSTRSTRGLGGGVLDDIGARNADLERMRREYGAIERAQNRVREGVERENKARQRTIDLEIMRSKYKEQGYSSSQANKLSSLELGGASPEQLKQLRDHYTQLNESLSRTSDTLGRATAQNNKWYDSIKGIAGYAILSAAIYGVMTAVTNLTVATVKMADEYTSIQNRMKLYVSDANTLNHINSEMVRMSMENNVGLRETATLYTRLAPSMQKLGANTKAITSVVDAFGKSLRIGGATAMEASSATIQFSQAMASGKLAGDEFRSISEASPRFLKAIADGADIATENLKKMSSEGALTTEVIAKALIKEYPKLIAENARLGVTLEQGANAVKTAFTMAIGEFNEGAKITESVGSALMGVASGFASFATDARSAGAELKKWYTEHSANLGLVVDVVKGIGVAFLATKVIGVASMVATTASTGVLTGALVRAYGATIALNTALSANPIGLVLKVLGGLAVGVTAFLALRSGAEDANAEIARTGGLVAKASKELGKLEGAEKTKAKNDLAEQLKVQNEELERLEQKYKSALARTKVENADLGTKSKLMRDLQKETVSLTGATDTLNNLKSAKGDDVKKLRDIQVEYRKQLGLTQETTEKQKALGVEGEIAGNAIENGMKIAEGAVGDLDNAVINATTSFTNLISKAKDATKINEIAFNLKKGVMAGNSDSDIREMAGYIYTNRKELYNTETGKLGITQEVLDAYKSKTDSDALWESIKEKKAKKPKKTDAEKGLDNIADQIEQQSTYLAVLKKIQDVDLARIASTKDYIKAYGGNLAVAQQMLNLEREITRVQAQRGLQKQNEDRQKAVGLMQQGFSKEVSSATINAGFGNDASGINYAWNLANDKALERITLLTEELTLQQDIQREIAKGVDPSVAMEVASLKRVKHNGMSLNALAQEIDMQTEILNAEKARTALVTTFVEAKKEAVMYGSQESNQVAQIMLQYKGVEASEAKQLLNQQKIVETLKEYNAEKAKQQTFEGMIESVDFDIFGDFGDPFEGALNSLNDMVFGVKAVEEAYTAMYNQIDALQAQTFEGTEEYNKYELQRNKVLESQEIGRAKTRDKNIKTGLALTKSFFKEETTGYKVMQGLERAYQASQIAFSLWKKKDSIQSTALELANKAKEMVMSQALNVQAGIRAVLEQAKGDPYTAFARMAAMVAVVGALGVAIGGAVGGSSGSYVGTENNGTGTVFGDKNAVSESIKNSIDILADNSDLMLPINSAMLRSVQNIESAIGGVANLLIRGQVGSFADNLGFDGKVAGAGGLVNKLDSIVNKMVVNVMSGGLSNILGDFSPTKLLGGVVGNITNTIVGGLFGKTSSKVTASGIYGGQQSLGSIISNGINLKEYADIETTKKSWFSKSTSKSTKFQNASDELENQFTLIFSNVFDSILSASSSLGRDGKAVTDILNNTMVNLGKINTKGKTGSEIQEALEGAIGQQADIIAKASVAGLDAFQQVGEGYFETLVRVASGIERAEYYSKLLGISMIEYTKIANKQGDVTAELIRQSVLVSDKIKYVKGGFKDLVNGFEGTGDELYDFINTLYSLQDAIRATGKDGDYLTTSMIQGAGGADRLDSGLSAYFDMMSTSEKAFELQRRMNEQFKALGVALPSSVSGYRSLISSIDITTESGQLLYGQLIALAPEFADMQDAMESYYDELVEQQRAWLAGTKEAKQYTDALRINYKVMNNLKGTASEISYTVLKASMLAHLGTSELNKNFVTLIKTFDGTGSELYNFLVKMNTVKDGIYLTGQSFSNVTQTMLDGANGVDGLVTGLNGYYDMLSDSEKATELTRRMSATFEALGLTLPTSIEAYKDLVKGIDTSTSSGQKLFGQVIALSPEFTKLNTALGNVSGEVDKLVQSLRDLAQTAIEAQGEAKPLDNLQYLREQFKLESQLALSGDVEATERMIELGKSLLEQSKGYASDQADYSSDIKLVQSVANGTAIAHESGLGYTNGAIDLTPNVNSSTGGLKTDTTTTDAKLDQLNTDLITALTAIAKYTQSTSNRLERLDDGDRLVVRIEQDPTDPAIRVKNT